MIIDGKKIANAILAQLYERVDRLPSRPLFCDVVVGNDPVSLSYVKMKGKTAERVGIEFLQVQLQESVTQEELVLTLEGLNRKERMCGLIVQLPLPAEMDRGAVLGAIHPDIDVDCIGGAGASAFYGGVSRLTPPTAAAVMTLLDSVPVIFEGKRVLVIGQGELVGKPVTHLLKSRGVEPLVADKATENLPELLRSADVIVSGTGKPKLITGQMVKPGCVVVDAGTAETDGGIVGDVDFESVNQVASYVSPVPGGVGPVTVAKLLENVVKVASSKLQ